MRKLLLVFVLILTATAGLLYYAHEEARRDPMVRMATIRLPHWPARARPVRTALIAPLSRLRPPLGAVAVLENHDHWTAPSRFAMN